MNSEDDRNAMSSELLRQVVELQDHFVQTSAKLSQHNFLTNAGGAVAVLGYMGSSGMVGYGLLALGIYAVGVLLSGLELRSLLNVYGKLHQDASQRYRAWSEGTGSVEDTIPKKNIAAPWGEIHRWSGIFAQFLFLSGTAVGVVGYLCAL